MGKQPYKNYRSWIDEALSKFIELNPCAKTMTTHQIFLLYRDGKLKNGKIKL